MLNVYQEELKDLVHEATSAGFRLEIHVIGDRAAETALDALDAVNVAPEKRTILTHCQVTSHLFSFFISLYFIFSLSLSLPHSPSLFLSLSFCLDLVTVCFLFSFIFKIPHKPYVFCGLQILLYILYLLLQILKL